MWALAMSALATLPLAWPLRVARHRTTRTLRRRLRPASVCADSCASPRVTAAIGWHVGFFTCGFHIAFLSRTADRDRAVRAVRRRLGEALALIGLFNIGGSLAAGCAGAALPDEVAAALMTPAARRWSRSILLSPPTPLTFYLFAAGLGLTWLATVPPTAGLVGKLCGRATRHAVRTHVRRTRSAASSARGSADLRSRSSATTRGCGSRTSRLRCSRRREFADRRGEAGGCTGRGVMSWGGLDPPCELPPCAKRWSQGQPYDARRGAARGAEAVHFTASAPAVRNLARERVRRVRRRHGPSSSSTAYGSGHRSGTAPNDCAVFGWWQATRH